MSTATQDNVLYQKAMGSQELAPKPFLKRELLYVIDNNGSPSYERNQVEFETSALSTNSNWASFADAFITMPFVTSVVRSADHIDAAAGATYLHMKAGCPIIDKVSWSYNGDPVIAERDEVAGLVAFKQLTEFSLDDLHVKGEARGYHKDSNDWSYGVEGLRTDMTELVANPQWYIDTGRTAVLPSATAQSIGFDTYEYVAATHKHVYRKDMKIFLRDLPGFSSFPLTRGGSVKITIRLNQGSVVRTNTLHAAAAGGVPDVPASMAVANSLKGSIVPVMVTGDFTTPPTGTTETIKFGIGTTDGYQCEKKNCRLYIPTVVMEPSAELAYLAQGEKSMVYDDYLFVPSRNNAQGQFNINLSNSVKRAKALLIIPQLSSASNLGVRPAESLVYPAPSCCSPCAIADFNVELAGQDIYSKPLQYRFEHFEQELSQGKLGVDSGMEDGVCSSLLTMKDYNNNFGYLYTDLSRRYDFDSNTNINIAVRGRITSPLALDFNCYIIFEKDLSIDITTGAKLV